MANSLRLQSGVLVLADTTAVYEGLFILDANKFAREREGLARQRQVALGEDDGRGVISLLQEHRALRCAE